MNKIQTAKSKKYTDCGYSLNCFLDNGTAVLRRMQGAFAYWVYIDTNGNVND